MKNKNFYLTIAAWLSAFLLLSSGIHAQYNTTERFLKANSVWVFNDSLGLDFNSTPPSPFHSEMNFRAIEGAASVADPVTGDLLFYWGGGDLNGIGNLYNAQHQPMPNGTGVLAGKSTTQGACIVPMIDSPNKYYVFNLFGPTDVNSWPSPFGSLFCSVVDMTLDSSRGDVIAGQKDILLDTDTLSESMIAIPGDNCDIWLLVHTANYPKFKAYHITAAGIDPNPVVSIAGEQLQSIGGWWNNPSNMGAYMQGGMAVSPDRTTLAITSNSLWMWLTGWIPGISGTLLCKFDPATGIVSDGLLVGASGWSASTAAFSPDNSKLYIANNDVSRRSVLQQFTISNYDSTAIANSQINIDTLVAAYSSVTSSSLKLHNDTIYVMLYHDTVVGSINQPNLNGSACDYQPASIALLGFDALTAFSLPNEVVYPIPPDTIVTQTILDTLICSGWENGIDLHPAEVSDAYTYTWNDNSTDTVRTIFEEGVYWVTYGDSCNLIAVDTFKVRGADLTPPVITININELSTTMNNYASYQWLLNGHVLSGATESTYTVLENGAYQVIVTNEQGCVDTSEVYEINNVSITEPGAIAALINVWPNPVQEEVFVRAPVPLQLSLTSISGKLIQTSVQRQSLSMRGLGAGIYLLRICDQDGRLIKVKKLVKERK